MTVSRFLLAVVPAVAMLTACSAQQQIVAAGNVQKIWTNAKADMDLWAKQHPQDQAAITRVENLVNPEVTALASDAPITSVSTALHDIENHILALPPGVLSQTVQDALDGAILLAGLSSTLTVTPPPVTTAAPVATPPPAAPPASTAPAS